MSNELEIRPGVIWEEDERDYTIESILGAEPWETAELPLEWFMTIEEGNQNAQPETYYACTCYSAMHAIQAATAINESPDFIKAFRKQKEYGTFVEGVGDYARTAFKSIIENGAPFGKTTLKLDTYALVGNGQTVNPKKLRYYLSLGFGLVTSYELRADHDYKTTGWIKPSNGKISGAHMVAITGYGDGWFEITNSYGSKWGRFKNGTFRVKDKDLPVLRGIYALFHNKETMIYKDVSDKHPYAKSIQWAKDKGLMTGTNEGLFLPDKAVTRAEMALILHRQHGGA